MKLKIINTGSEANGYILQPSTPEGTAIAIEAGCPFLEAAKALNFDVSKLRAVFISHEHQDHAKKIKEWIAAGLQIVASNGTLEAIQAKTPGGWYKAIKAGREPVKIEEWRAAAFNTVHDAAEPTGFLFKHPEAKVLFLTDSGRIRLITNGVNCFIVECNWTFDELMQSNDPQALKNRIMQTHTGLETLREFFLVQGMQQARKIVLIHASSRNCDIERAVKEIEAITGVPTYAARKGETIEF